MLLEKHETIKRYFLRISGRISQMWNKWVLKFRRNFFCGQPQGPFRIFSGIRFVPHVTAEIQDIELFKLPNQKYFVVLLSSYLYYRHLLFTVVPK